MKETLISMLFKNARMSKIYDMIEDEIMSC